MAEDKEVLRYCRDCEYVYALLHCGRHVVHNRYTGISYLRNTLTRETNNEGKCPHFKPKPSFWQWIKGLCPDYKEKVE